MPEVSKECSQSIENLNILINKAVKEIKIANARASTAEKMIERLRETSQEEITKAYNAGYNKALQDIDSNGGSSKNKEENKLTLKNG